MKMTEEQENALAAVVAYLFDEEKKHWEEADEPREHIYHSLQVLYGYLESLAYSRRLPTV